MHVKGGWVRGGESRRNACEVGWGGGERGLSWICGGIYEVH